MQRSTMTLSFPPFTRAIKTLIAINGGIYFLQLLLRATGYGAAAAAIEQALALRASDVIHGKIYELVTYAFVHGDFFHIFFNMLMLWMFGSMLESVWGERKFWEFYLFGAIGAGLTAVVLAYTIGGIVHLDPGTLTIGASGAIYAIFMATAMLFGDRQVFMFPLPFTMKLKYMVGILGLIAVAGALGGGTRTANIAHLGGLLFGYLYVKFVPQRGLLFLASEGYYGIRNSYHRWKRNQAKKKFQVYMRKHEQDPKEYFDEYGNFRPPGEQEKKDRGPGGWVN